MPRYLGAALERHLEVPGQNTLCSVLELYECLPTIMSSSILAGKLAKEWLSKCMGRGRWGEGAQPHIWKSGVDTVVLLLMLRWHSFADAVDHFEISKMAWVVLILVCWCYCPGWASHIGGPCCWLVAWWHLVISWTDSIVGTRCCGIQAAFMALTLQKPELPYTHEHAGHAFSLHILITVPYPHTSVRGKETDQVS
jgi:hypothetical protein